MNLESLITTCKPYLGEVHPFLGVLSQLQRHGLSLKIYSIVFNLNYCVVNNSGLKIYWRIYIIL